jgi:hypothetical protein
MTSNNGINGLSPDDVVEVKLDPTTARRWREVRPDGKELARNHLADLARALLAGAHDNARGRHVGPGVPEVGPGDVDLAWRATHPVHRHRYPLAVWRTTQAFILGGACGIAMATLNYTQAEVSLGTVIGTSLALAVEQLLKRYS